MKSFDSGSIKNRLIDYLKTQGDWKRIIEDSAVLSFFDAMAEGNQELARYFEYLLRESRWDLAKNTTSLLSMSPYLGYRARRKISSIGYIYVSHSPLFKEAGSTFFESDLETLTPYIGANILVPQGTKFTDGTRTFLTTQEVTYTPAINNIATKYIKIPIIQGIRRSFTTNTSAAGIPFETIKVFNPSVENASDEISSRFFNVVGYLGGSLNSTPIIFSRKEDIHLASSDEFAYDIRTSPDFSFISVRFGDGYSGKVLPKGTVIKVDYLETLGQNGNQAEAYSIKNIDVSPTDPIALNLYCTNFDPCLGGRDQETLEDIRGLAPTQYLIEGSIITEDAYKKAIEEIPSVAKATVYSGVSKDIFGIYKDTVRYSAISVLGKPSERSFIESAVLDRLVGKKSPLDVIVYDEPRLVRLKLNIQGEVSNKEADIVSLTSSIKSIAYEDYNIFKMKFQEGFDSSALIKKLGQSAPSVERVEIMIETYERLKTSAFLPISGGEYYEKSFEFDTSFNGLKGFSNGKKYLVKLDINFKCVECQTNSRTFFLIADDDSGFRLAQYRLISNITSSDYMSSKVLKILEDPVEIKQDNPSFIPINISIEDITKPTWKGVVTIPLKKPGTQDYYINFTSTNTTDLDEQILIDISAEPISSNVSLKEVDDNDLPQKNRILYVEEDDIRTELKYRTI